MSIFKEMAQCLSFPKYRLFRADTAGKNFGYIIVLSIVCFLLTAVVGIYVPYKTMGGTDKISEHLPEFSMSPDGVLTVEQTVNHETSDGTRFVVDTSYDVNYDKSSGVVYDDLGNEILAKNDYNKFVVVAANAAVVKNDNGEVQQVDYKSIPAEYIGKINKATVLELINKFMLWLMVFLFVFIIIRLAVFNIVNAGISAIISSSMGVKNTFGQLYSMSLRAYTPVYIVKCVMSMLHLSLLQNIIGLVVTGLIMSKALKTIKQQLEEEKARDIAQVDNFSDLSYRSMYSDDGVYNTQDNNLDNNDKI